MNTTNSNHDSVIEAMLVKLRKMNKRGEKALRKADILLEKADKKYQKELASFKKKYAKNK